MSSSAQASSPQTEAEFLESMRSRYEAEGFIFTIAPDRSMLPRFLGSYLPDALARKPGLNIAIEVKQHQSQAAQAQLRHIRRLFEGHPDWQLSVAFIGFEPLQPVTIPTASPAVIRRGMKEVRELASRGQHRPAFVMAWPLLEAALQSVEDNQTTKARTSETVVQTLAMRGYIGQDLEQRMRGLIALRNRIVHGDIAAEPTAEDVDLMLTAVEETLAGNAS